MTTLLALVLLMTSPDESVQELVRKLGDDSPAVRAGAVEMLTGRGRAIVPDLKAALAEQSDPEVRARIAVVLRHLTQVRWLTDFQAGRKKAALEKKPLLVFSTVGPLDGFVWLGGHLMRTVTFADPGVVDLLNDRYVVVWNNHSMDRAERGEQARYGSEEMAAYPEGGGGNNLHTIVAGPDGTVLNALTGYWSAATLLDELEFSRGLTRENRAERQGMRQMTLRQEATKLMKDFPGEMGKRPKDSAVVRRIAALSLLARCHESTADGIDEYLAAVSERTRGRVHV